jgi:hypothetical protein
VPGHGASVRFGHVPVNPLGLHLNPRLTGGGCDGALGRVLWQLGQAAVRWV